MEQAVELDSALQREVEGYPTDADEADPVVEPRGQCGIDARQGLAQLAVAADGPEDSGLRLSRLMLMRVTPASFSARA